MNTRLTVLFAVLLLIFASCKKDSETLKPEDSEPAPPTEEPQQFKKQVLVEVFSNTTCGACPLAHHEIERLEDSLSSVTHISHKLSGPMAHEYTFYTISQNDRTLYTPLAHIQRIGDQELGPIYYGTSRFEEIIQGQLYAEHTNIGLEIEIDMADNQAQVSVKVQSFESFTETELKLTVLLVENKVTGTGQGYDQRNYGHTDPNHPYFGRGEWMEGYVHRNIVRQVLTDQAGELIQSEIPWDFERTFSLDLEELSDALEDYTVIAFVTKDTPVFSEMLNVGFVGLVH